MPKCAECQVDCRGKVCRKCFTQKGKTKETFNLHEITSSESINLDESGILPSNDGTLFSNPSFNTDGLLSDVVYTASAETNGAGEVPAETFSLVQLITTIVTREIAPLRKEIELIKSENKKLREDIDALKAEKEEMSAATATAASSPNGDIETALAPYKEALLKLAPIEQSLQNHQRYLDHDDAKKRETNVIITGVKEAVVEENEMNEENGESVGRAEIEEKKDTASIREILRVVGCSDVVPLKVKRLGNRNDQEGGRPRPLMVVTDSADTRRKILKKKMNLKESADNRFKAVYIKADEPIAVQKEWKRLRDALRKEKNAPTGPGATVRIDYKQRVLLRNDIVIDRFNSPFGKGGPSQSR